MAAVGLALWLREEGAARLTLQPSSYDQIAGWHEDRLAEAVPAFLKSCAAFRGKSDDASVDAVPRGTDFGRVRDWRGACDAAAALPAGDDRAAQRFFESAFVPYLAGNNGASEGLFTGYFEMTLVGSRQRGGRFQTPLYRRPANPGRYARAEIDDGALAGQGLELVWVDDPVDAFFLEIQGSGKVRLREGGTVRIGYDGSNGRPYVAVGRLLVEQGIVPRERLTMAAIRRWMAAHPQEAAALRRANPSYVFFREISGAGPIGAEQVVLTPWRSLAVDRAFLPLGAPVWVDVQQRFGTETIRRLMITQDTGGAIKGPVRGDLYCGGGAGAAAAAGAINARGRYYLLLPRAVASRASQTAALD